MQISNLIMELGEKGYEFAKNFTVERFEKGWEKVLSV